MTVAVFGLGQMGLPIVAGLVGQGVEVYAYDQDAARVALAASHGAVAASVVEASAQPLVLTLLPSDEALLALCLGPYGLAARLPAGGVHVCMGTIGVATARTLADAHAAAGQVFIACPVFGRPDEAWQRDLTAVFGAPQERDPVASSAQPLRHLRPAARVLAIAHARQAIALVAPRLHDVPSPEAACAVKLAGNGLIASAIAALTEAFGLVQAHGVAPPVLHAIVTGKLFQGPVYEGVGRMLSGAAPPPEVPGFTVRLGLKDLALCRDAAQAVAHPMPVADAVRGRLSDAARAGHGGRDWADLPRCLPAPTT
jgi:3-hydroxyisobutyrate dehydrogenase-like beta-hydroxyacid dehydrogenase